MKVGWGAGLALADIAEGIPTDEVRARWKAKVYGAEHERPSAQMMAGWLKLAGRE